MTPDLAHPSILLFYILVAGLLGCVVWKLVARSRGECFGEPELYGALTYLAAFAVQAVLYTQGRPVFANVDFVSLLADAILVTGFTAIALNANRVWPLIAAGAQLLGIFSHFSRAVQLNIDPWAYAILYVLPTGVVLVCVIVGFIGHFRRMKRFGHDPDWMDWTHFRELGPTRG